MGYFLNLPPLRITHNHSKESGASDFSSAPQAREEWKEVMPWLQKLTGPKSR